MLFTLFLQSSCNKDATPSPTITDTEIASKYPADVGIENDSDVVFTEMAEESSLTELFANWSGNSTSNSVAFDSSTKPALSQGNKVIRLFTTAGPQGPGTIRTAFLSKLFSGGYEGTLYARWYVKYNTYGTFHHSGIRLGGDFPESTVPLSHAGTLPNGADFFYLGAELTQGVTAPTSNSTVDFFNYWMHQRGTSFFPGLYYGNSFINDPAVNVNTDNWNCIEVQLTLNDPITGYNGEIAMWLNDLKVSHIQTGTLGTWTEDNFKPDASGTPFEGFQWRNNLNLKINYFHLNHYVDQDPTGQVNSIYFDHIVVAKKRIGCLR